MKTSQASTVRRAGRNPTIGFARVCITDGWKHPRPGCEFPEYTIHDNLYATALVVCGSGKPLAALVSLDLGVITRPPGDEIRALVSEKTDIRADAVALHTTHTHAGYSGNDVDPGFLGGRIVEAIDQAAASARPASVAHRHGELGVGYNFNRRVHLSDGLGAHCVMFNTDCRTAGGRVEATGQLRKVVRDWEVNWDDLEMSRRENWADGPIDSHLHVLSFHDGEKRLGSVVRFCGHPVIVSRHWIGDELSRDAVGCVADVLAEATGAPCLYLTGPSGNLRLYCEEYSHVEAKKRGQLIAEHALRLLLDCVHAPVDRFGFASREIELALWPGFPASRDEQRRKEAELEAAVKNAIARRRGPARLKKLAEEHARMKFAGQMFDGRVLTLDEAAAGRFRQPLAAFDFGVAALVTFPCEPFQEVSRRVREKAGANVITVQLTNGSHGYVPTAEEWALGGYETTWCSTAPETAETYVSAASSLVAGARQT